MWLVNFNYNFECDWLIELSDNKLSDNKVSDNKLSDNNLASELVGNRSFFITNYNWGNCNSYDYENNAPVVHMVPLFVWHLLARKRTKIYNTCRTIVQIFKPFVLRPFHCRCNLYKVPAVVVY